MKSAKNKKIRHGSSLDHGEAHDHDHKGWSRRNFLKSMGIAGGTTAMLGGLPLSAIHYSRLNMLNSGVDDRAMIIIRMDGGNDGLNTIIPLNQYSTYSNLRPTLAIPQNQLWNLSPEFAMPNYMNDLESMWGDGAMKVIHNVGYANPNLSHFRSMDIWESATESNEQRGSGFLGELAMQQHPDLILNPPEHPVAIQVGGNGSILFNNEDLINVAFSVTDPEQLADIAENGQLYDPLDVPDCYLGEQLTFLRATTNNTFTYAGVLPEVYANGLNVVEYEGELGAQLGVIARLIKGGLKTKLFMISISGFDTHAEQGDWHRELVSQISSQIKLFYNDLQHAGRQDDVLCMTVSEFGRRIEENASLGTDHGAAAPMMLFGPGLNGSGLLGNGPDLTNTDEVGNLQYEFDFKSVYATVLEKWLCIDPSLVDSVLSGTYDRLDLGFDCIATSVTDNSPKPTLDSQVRYMPSGDLALHYKLPIGGEVKIDLYTIVGQQIKSLFSGYQSAGEQVLPFRPGARYPGGTYIIRLALNNKVVTEKIHLIR